MMYERISLGNGSHPIVFRAMFEKDGEVAVEKRAPGATGNVSIYICYTVIPQMWTSEGCRFLSWVRD